MDYVSLVRKICEGIERGDPQPLLAALADDVVWNEAEHSTLWPGTSFVGRDAIISGVFARIPRHFDGLQLEVQRIVGCGDTVLVEGRYRAVARATGRRLDAQVAHVWQFKDDKVIRWQQYTDTWQFAEVTGIRPAS